MTKLISPGALAASPASTRSGVRASAGSGKTYELTNHYLRSFFLGAKPGSILATTFTRKAAGEILGRVLTRLCDACCDDEKLADFAGTLGIEQLDREQAKGALLALCRDLHQVRIATLDSIFGQMLRGYCHDLGISPDLRMCDETAPEVEQIRLEALRQVLSGSERELILRLLDALEAGRARSVVTSSLLEKLQDAHEIFESAPESAWNLTVSPRKKLSEAELNAALEVLATFATDAEYSRLAKTLDNDLERARDENWSGFLGNGIGCKILNEEEVFSKKPIPPEICDAYQPIVEHASAVLLQGHLAKTSALREALALYHEGYTELRGQQRVLLFRDVPLMLSGVLSSQTPDDLVHRLDTQIECLLLDEFQDTSPQQYAILKPFARRIAQLPPEQGAFFCVGDLKQSIYGWRGATSEIFQRLEDEFKELSWRDSDKSFRSSPVVLESVNQLFGGLIENSGVPQKWRLAAEQWCKFFNAHSAAKEHLEGFVEVVQSGAPGEEIEAVFDESGESSVTADPHFDFAAQRIKEIAASRPAATVGVLLRSNAAVRSMIYLLRKKGVAAATESGESIAEDPAVALVLSALHFADHPGDSTAHFHLLQSPLAHSLRLKGDRALSPCAASLEIRRHLFDGGIAATIEDWCRVLAPSCNEAGARRLMQLVAFADREAAAAPLGAKEFAAKVKLEAFEQSSPAPVRVMTIHKSKGLEFDVVVLPELHKKLLQPGKLLTTRDASTLEINAICAWPAEALRKIEPQFEKMHQEYSDAQVREALCTVYVAMTRARQALHLVVPALKVGKSGKVGATPESAASIVRAGLCGEAALTDADLPAELYEHGNRNWILDQKQETASAEVKRSADDSPPRHFSTSTNERPPRAWKRVSPSSLEGGVSRSAAQLLQLDPAGQRGTALHKLLSRVEWLEQFSLGDEDLAKYLRNEMPGMSVGDAQEHVRSFRALLELSENRRCLLRPETCGSETVEVWRERGFAVRMESTLVTGTFDRVLVFRVEGQVQRAEVIDFKTGHDDDSAVEEYRPQLKLYREVLQHMLGLPAEQIGCRLLFTASGTSVDF